MCHRVDMAKIEKKKFLKLEIENFKRDCHDVRKAGGSLMRKVAKLEKISL